MDNFTINVTPGKENPAPLAVSVRVLRILGWKRLIMSSSQAIILPAHFGDISELLTGLGSTGSLRAKSKCNNAGKSETTIFKVILP